MRFISILVFLIITTISHSQNEDKALFIKSIYDFTLDEGNCYNWLSHLSENIGGRLTGSEGAAKGVDYTFELMNLLEMDTVIKQDCMVPHWERGKKESVSFVDPSTKENIELSCTALGNSVGTNGKNMTGEVIELLSLDELESVGEKNLKGKIVFFNRPMDPKTINAFNAYGGASDQRVFGPSRSAKYGALGVIVRSITHSQDDVPHTGVTVYEDGVRKIPGLAISTNAADLLSAAISKGTVNVTINNDSRMLSDKPSHNVVGEIRGSEFPEKIILVGGHLDSWDLAGGAHDDGAGCMHSIQVIETLKKLGYQPRHTIRCVMFMNEENGLAGGLEYAKISNDKEEFHMAAIESDAGGFTPRGFTCSADSEVFVDKLTQVKEWFGLLESYDLFFDKGGAGADISPLKSQKGLLIGFRPDSQRYFDFHHTANDRIDAVNERELKLGAAAITSLVYLIDQYGIN